MISRTRSDMTQWPLSSKDLSDGTASRPEWTAMTRLAISVNHYHEYGAQAHRADQEFQHQNKGEDEEDAASSTPKDVAETLEWEQVVFHTPTKVARRPSLLDKLQRAQEGTEQDWSDDERVVFKQLLHSPPLSPK
ncbi:hypothetical protein MVEG_08684 [Podila verticillata NRRL 6337]|nr:hypothetical protein MVEG_08684 [Podila verticillata NRRL 6337]